MIKRWVAKSWNFTPVTSWHAGVLSSVAEFIDPDWGYKVNSGIGLLYRPDRLHGLAGRYDNPSRSWLYPPSQWSMNSASVHTHCAQAHSRHMMAYRSAHFLVMMFQHNSSSSPSLHLDDLGGRGGWGKSDQKEQRRRASQDSQGCTEQITYNELD